MRINNLQIISLCYFGQELTQNDLERIGSIIKERTGATVMEVTQNNGKDIMLDTIRDCVKNICKSYYPECEEYTEEDNATIFIGTTFKDALSKYDKRPSILINKIVDKVNECKSSPNDEKSRIFINAMTILSRQDLKISESLLKKYNLDAEKIRVIRNTYDFANSITL